MAPNPEQIAAFLSRIHLFRALDPEKLRGAAALLRVVEHPADAVVYEQGEGAPEMYFLYSGRLKMTRFEPSTREERMLGFLDEGDFFGGEAFEGDRPRQSTVNAITDVTLLALDVAGARELVELIPEFPGRYNLTLDSFNLMLKTPFAWVSPEEYVYYVARKHPIFLWVRLIPWALAGAAGLGILLGLLPLQHVTIFLLIVALGLLVIVLGLIWHWVDWANDYYVITARRVAYQEKVVLLYDSRQESPIEQIQSTMVDSSQIGRIFHYGDVTIRTFTGTIVFRAVRNPADVVGLVQEMQKRSQSSLRQAELRQIEETLRQRLTVRPSAGLPPPKPVAPPVNPLVTRIRRFLADLFHLRYEFGDTIQYRTHWWILLRRIFLPSLLLLLSLWLGIWIVTRAIAGQLANFPVLGAFTALCAVSLLVFMWWLYNYLDWHNDIYLVNNEQVMDVNRKPLGKEEKRAAQIKNILSIEYKRIGIIGLLLNFGTVYIRVGETTLTFDDVYNPAEVQRELFHRLSQRTLKDRQAQSEAERQRIADWITAYDRIKNTP